MTEAVKLVREQNLPASQVARDLGVYPETLRRHPTVFLKMTGLRLNEFEQLLTDMLPQIAQAQRARLQRADRRRAVGAGRHAALTRTNQLLLTIIWLRQYPTNELLGYLFGVSDSTASRILARVLPMPCAVVSTGSTSSTSS